MKLDKYTYCARLLPALLVVNPLLIVLFLILPSVWQLLGVISAAGLYGFDFPSCTVWTGYGEAERAWALRSVGRQANKPIASALGWCIVAGHKSAVS